MEEVAIIPVTLTVAYSSVEQNLPKTWEVDIFIANRG